MRDKRRTNEQTVKIELLSQWMLEAEFRNTSVAHVNKVDDIRNDKAEGEGAKHDEEPKSKSTK